MLQRMGGRRNLGPIAILHVRRLLEDVQDASVHYLNEVLGAVGAIDGRGVTFQHDKFWPSPDGQHNGI